jgi:hypothetical protein
LYALLALVLYSANGRLIASGDSLPARFLPFAILGYGTVALDPVSDAARNGYEVAYWMRPSMTGHMASLFPITTPVLVTPLYVPAVVYLSATGWTEPRLRALSAIMEKVSASLVAAAAVGLMFILLRRSTTLRDARLLTLAFAAGTAMWPIASQALWQHGVGQLSLIVALLAVTAPPRWSRVVIGGCAVGILAANRPLDGLFAAGIGIYACWWARGRFPIFALAAAIPVVLVLWYNLWMFGHVWGGYGVTGHISVHFFERYPHPRWEGIAGLLISPGNGLFVFSPFLLLLLCANPFRGHARPVLALLLAFAVGVQVWGYAGIDWRGGHVYGPRFLADTIPILVWLLIVPLAALTPSRRALFTTAVACAIVVQAIGAFKFMGQSSLNLHAPGQTAAYERSWRIRDSPILVEAGEPFAPMYLLDEMARLR